MSLDVVMKCIRTPTGIATARCGTNLYKPKKPRRRGLYGDITLVVFIMLLYIVE